MADFDPDKFLAQTSAPAGTAQGFDPDKFLQETESPSLGGFARNALKDVRETAAGVGGLAKKIFEPATPLPDAGEVNTPREALEDVKATAGPLLSPLVNEAKRIGVVGEGGLVSTQAPFIHPIDAAQKFGKAFYQKPVTTALDVAPVIPEIGKVLGIGSKAGEATEAASTAGKAAEAGSEASKSVTVPGINIGKTSTKEGGGFALSNPSAPAAENGMAGAVKSIASKVGNLSQSVADKEAAVKNYLINTYGKAKEVENYLDRGWEGFTKKPGAIANTADYFQAKSQMMALQQMGFTPGQVRNLGSTPMDVHNAERAIGQYGIDSGIVSPTRGLKGMVERNDELLNLTGQTIGNFRKAADNVTGGYKPGELLAAVKERLDPVYLRGVTAETPIARGVRGTEAPAYQRALQELEDAERTHEAAGEVATRLNHEATQATKMSQNPGPYTDVANAISEINNARVKASIGAENATKYERALREFGVNKKISNGLKYKSSTEVKRLGPGSLTREMAQKFMDEMGYRAGAKITNKVSTSIIKNPSVMKSLPSLFKEFINQAEEVGHELTD